MSLYFASINSGSNGNCYYIGTENEAVLIDAGISCRETEKRIAALGLDIKNVKAIFISHEHTDHIKGLEVLSKKHRIPVYISALTLTHSKLSIDRALLHTLETGSDYKIGELTIHSFAKFHDAADPCSFTIAHRDTRIAVITDIGRCCANVIDHFSQCDAALIEANYDEFLLDNGRYPFYLKRRISGGRGHISNKEALELFTKHRSERLSHLLLGHLSADNNHPDIVSELFSHFSGTTSVHVASRYEASPVFAIAGNPEIPYRSNREVQTPAQLTLF